MYLLCSSEMLSDGGLVHFVAGEYGWDDEILKEIVGEDSEGITDFADLE